MNLICFMKYPPEAGLMNHIKKHVIFIFAAIFIYTGTAQASIYMQVTKRTGNFMIGTFYYDLLDWTIDDNTPTRATKNRNVK